MDIHVVNFPWGFKTSRDEILESFRENVDSILSIHYYQLGCGPSQPKLFFYVSEEKIFLFGSLDGIKKRYMCQRKLDKQKWSSFLGQVMYWLVIFLKMFQFYLIFYFTRDRLHLKNFLLQSKSSK